MFSLWGASLVPQIEEMLGHSKKLLSRVIIVSLLIPIIAYLCFTVIVLGLAGNTVTPSALTGLGTQFGWGIQVLLFLLGLVTTFTSLVLVGMTFKQVLQYDLHLRDSSAWLWTCLTPLALYLLGVQSFIGVISFIGAVFLAIDGINILLMYRKGVPRAVPWKRVTSLILIPVLLGGIIYEIGDLFIGW